MPHSLAVMAAARLSIMTISPGFSAGTRLSWPQARDRAVDRPVEVTRRCDPIVAQSRDVGRRDVGPGFSALEWRLAHHPAAARS